MPCQAVTVGQQNVCHHCDVCWDIDDKDVPVCINTSVKQILAGFEPRYRVEYLNSRGIWFIWDRNEGRALLDTFASEAKANNKVERLISHE